MPRVESCALFALIVAMPNTIFDLSAFPITLKPVHALEMIFSTTPIRTAMGNCNSFQSIAVLGDAIWLI
jgi:hypothetical protein